MLGFLLSFLMDMGCGLLECCAEAVCVETFAAPDLIPESDFADWSGFETEFETLESGPKLGLLHRMVINKEFRKAMLSPLLEEEK